MEYGNAWSTARRAVLIGCVIGSAAAAAGVIGISVEGRWSLARPWSLAVLALVPPAAMAVAVGFTAAFRVRVDDGWVRHVLLGRVTLGRGRVADFETVQPGGLGPTLRFRGGKRIRLVGMRLRELDRLAADLRRAQAGPATAVGQSAGGEGDAAPSHVLVHDFDARRTYRIPAAELAPGMIRVHVRGLNAGEPVWMDPAQLHAGEVRHPPFGDDLRSYVREIMDAFAEVHPLSFDEWEDWFRRDEHPEREIALWSHAADVYRSAADPAWPPPHRRELYRVLVACMTSSPEHVWHVVRLEHLPRGLAERVVARFYGLPDPTPGRPDRS